MTTRRIALTTALALVLLAPAASIAATPRTSLTAVWNDFMCTACHEPLPVAQAPEAYSERTYIEMLIAKGYDEAQIKRAMVAAYGPAVLAKPPAHGFNLTVYLLPPAVVLAGLAVLAFTLPRWRRRTRLAAASAAKPPPLDPAEERRLEEELARFGG
jgi:cytochrome c-type biogenesis protein CcmH